MDAWVLNNIEGEKAELNIYGGNFNVNPANWCVDGRYAVKQPGTDPVLYKVGKLPNAEVVNLGPSTVEPDNYYIFDIMTGASSPANTGSFDMQVALNFIAKDSGDQAAANPYGQYYTDFRIKIEGLASDEIIADEDCYLVGNYAGMWVKVNLNEFPIENGVGYPVITGLFPFTYEDICRYVESFVCGIHLSDEILAANPNLKVSLELGLAETKDDMISGTGFIQVGAPYVYDVEDMLHTVAIAGDDYYTTVTGAVAVAVQSGNFVKIAVSADVEDDLAIAGAKNFAIDLGGNVLSVADGKKLQIENSIVFMTNGTLSASAQSVVLEGASVLTVTDKTFANQFREKNGYYVAQNADGVTHSIMLKSKFPLHIAMEDGEPRLGFFKDFAAGTTYTYALYGASNLDNPDWTVLSYGDAESIKSELPLYWSKLTGDAAAGNWRFFKIGPAPAAE
jgi:hypothetical protein